LSLTCSDTAARVEKIRAPVMPFNDAPADGLMAAGLMNPGREGVGEAQDQTNFGLNALDGNTLGAA